MKKVKEDESVLQWLELYMVEKKNRAEKVIVYCRYAMCMNIKLLLSEEIIANNFRRL